MEYNEVTEAGEKSFQPQAFSYSGVRSENPSLANVSKREFLNRPKLQKEVLGYRLDGKEDFDPLKEFEGIFEDKIIPDNFNSTDGQINDIYDESETIEFSDGGEVNNNGRTDELIRFEGGGTHEQNPLGGIPLGFGSNGKQNTVEEGETKFSFDDGDYIFSNRIITGKKISDTNQFANGGKIDPKKKEPVKPIGNLSTDQALDVEAQRGWLNEWNNNREVEGKKLRNNTSIPFSGDIYMDDLNYNNTRAKTYGEFDSISNRIIFDNNYKDKEGIPTHEFSHRFQKDLKVNNKNNYDQYINDPILNELSSIKGLSPYKSDPEENHAEINRFRFNNNLKPDQVITPEDIESYDFNGYNLEHFNKKQMLNLLNKTASNDEIKKMNYAAFGGYMLKNNKKK